METIGFPTYLDFMKGEQESRCINTDADLFCIVCGPERSGKSLVVMATGCHLDTRYNIGNIFYDGQEYTKLLLEVAKTRGTEYSPELIEKHNVMGVDLTEFRNIKAQRYEHGAVLHYDEAGQGMSNREAFKNIDQYKTLQCMGHLRMVNFWCAPKLRVIDVYAREERVKFFIWVDNLGTKDKPERLMFIWTRESLAHLLIDPYWKTNMMLGTKYIVKKYRPDLRVPIPNLLSGKDPYIKPELYEAYKVRKLLWDYKRLLATTTADSGKPIKHPVKEGQTFEDWHKETGLSERSYREYKKRGRQT